MDDYSLTLSRLMSIVVLTTPAAARTPTSVAAASNTENVFLRPIRLIGRRLTEDRIHHWQG
jgi:hypothetical protein